MQAPCDRNFRKEFQHFQHSPSIAESSLLIVSSAMSNIDRQCCNWISCSNVTHSEQLAFAESIPTSGFSSYDSNFLPPTFQNSFYEFPSMHFLLSNTIQSPKTNCIKDSLAVFWASEVQQLHTIPFRRELNREQYQSNYSHAQRQLLWDIADRTPRPVKHALKPVDIAVQYTTLIRK